MKHRWFIGIALVLCVLAGWVVLSSPPLNETSEPKLPPQIAATDTLQTPTSDAPNLTWDRTLRMALISTSGVSQTTLRVERVPQPGVFVTVESKESTLNHDHWRDLLHVAAFVALESVTDPPPGIRLTWSPVQAEPSLHQLGSLTLAIRCAVLGKAYPESDLLAGTVSPSYRLFNSSQWSSLQSVAKQAHKTLGDAPAVQARYWSDPRPPRAWVAGTRPDGKRTAAPTPPKSVLKALQQVLGDLVHGHTASLPLPENWSQSQAHAEGRFRSTQYQNLTEAFELGLLAARIRAGIREAMWAAQRIPLFSQRLIREHRHQDLDGWRLSWLALLVSARVQGEETLRTLMKTGPPSVPRKQPIRIPNPWLRQRAALYTNVATRMTRLWRRALGERPEPPNGYPAHDLRNLSWSPSPDDAHSSPLANWMTAMDRTALVWAQIAILDGLNPTHASPGEGETDWTFPDVEAVARMDGQAQQVNDDHHKRLLMTSPALPPALKPVMHADTEPIQRIERAWRQVVLRRGWHALQQAAAQQKQK
jgi:hypothetical protein